MTDAAVGAVLLFGPFATGLLADRPPDDPGAAVESGAQEPPFARLSLDGAPALERQLLEPLLDAPHWMPRALATVRLERFHCVETRLMLEKMLTDPAWQVRAFAVRSLARRGTPAAEEWFEDEQHPRVIRAIVRHGYEIDPDRFGRGVRALARSGNLDEMLLAAELGANASDQELRRLARETARTVALRMNRVQAGPLSPRLAALTDGIDRRNRYEWQRFINKSGRRFELTPILSVPGDGVAVEPSFLARVNTARFARFERYMREVSRRRLELVIVLDATGSMSGVFHRTLGCVDDLLLIGRDMTESFRAGLVAYRDRRQKFETRAWGFDTTLDQLRSHMWLQEADEGGAATESVFAALSIACAEMSWLPASDKVVLLIGDGPPHVGEGARCIDLARRAKVQRGITTHVVQPRGTEIKHFPEIAEAGGGRTADLDGFISLIRDVLGWRDNEEIDEEFREFLLTYFELCR